MKMDLVQNNILGPKDTVKRAIEIAKSHITEKSRRFPKGLGIQLDKNYLNILETYKLASDEIKRSVPSTPTVEWLLDNFYIIEEQVKDIKRLLDKKDNFLLPVLTEGELKGYPRVYALAIEAIAHSDGSIDENGLVSFLKAYQSEKTLLMSELWAMPIMLRMALIEKISHLCDDLKVYSQQRDEALKLASTIITALDKDDKYVLRAVNEGIEVKSDFNSSFIEVLARSLRRGGKKAAAVVGLIDEKLTDKGLSLEELVNFDHQIQAARQVSMGNSITGLRSIAAIDWNEFFEALSKIEEILRRDPSDYYRRMDFESRDYYRHVIEKLSRLYNLSEIEVARKALRCAEKSVEDDSLKHIGYYLVSAGRSLLEEELGLKRSFRLQPQFIYFASIALLSFLLMGLFLEYSTNQGVNSLGILLLIGLVLLIPISEIAINTVNFTVSRIYPPVVLPKLELLTGIPKESSTMVIIPTLLTNEARVSELIEKLEVYYLANKEENLHFALVGDFKDFALKEAKDDSAIVDRALQGIKALNRRFSNDKPIFYYFHRERLYNEANDSWMGWERKRGAIVEFNDLLRGSKETSFKILSCSPEEIPYVRYVITLDADTNLSLGNARKLIGTMAHPLNRPVMDEEKGLIIKGFGILQPRIGVSLESANKTLFSRVFAGQGGIDPYTTAVSDIYQDLFGEGIFTGKGIYEVDTFQGLLKDAIPENSVLSHDLLEGSYIRAGLVTDIELIDGYPARYNSYSMRQHRWVRGDWQLIPWLAGRVKGKAGQLRGNPLSGLSKWKIFDNLRRSLVNPALLALIVLGYSILPGNSLVWLGLALLTLAFPIITYLLGGVIAKANDFSEDSNNQTIINGVRASLYQMLLQFIFIPYQAYLMLDAIARTLVRVLVSRKNLLEWIPAADLESLLKNDLKTYFKNMSIAPIFGLVVLGLAFWRTLTNPELFMAALVFASWAVSPYVAYKISQDYEKEKERLDANGEHELRRLARRTWAYFEDLVTEKDNYLPPDNYQVDPPKGIAHRTSPTNIGMLLVATLAARDFGFLGTGEMFKRVNGTLSSVEKMEKWEGHLYNWYDTQSLQVLRPRFISTVDSGNFVSYLMVLEEGIKEYVSKPLDTKLFAKGLLDTIELFNEEFKEETVIDTKRLEEYLASYKEDCGDFAKALALISAQLEESPKKEKLKRSFWGTNVTERIEALNKELTLSLDSLQAQGSELIKRIRVLIENTSFAPLFDPKRQLFSIGYNVEEGMLTKSYYDLLASEARVASYIAIAKGEVSKKHWFRLGRKLTQVGNQRGLVSWTGTMFEYMMPLLIMKNYRKSLLDETYSFVVAAQKKYGQSRNIPWGISESGYHAFDVALNYQYKAFGVPELGFKRGLGDELVVAPYATVMALAVSPRESYKNLTRLKEAGMEGNYGLFEAIDYTPVRSALYGERAIVKSFMAHHQGMSLLAIANYFTDNNMQKRFHANPLIKSAEVLLQERTPINLSIVKEHKEDYKPLKRVIEDREGLVRNYGYPDSELPNVHLLSNGSYSVMLTNGGSGYSKYRDMAVARWKENLGGSSGFFIYIQNINSNNAWSATYEPYNVRAEEYKAVFSPDKAEFFRKDGSIETHTQVVVSPEDDAEIRTVTLTNNSQHARTLEVTSYLEVVLTHPDNDLAHPAFSNLFVTTEFIKQYDCLLAERRARSAEQEPVYALHSINVEGEGIGELQYETDRSKFIGRNRGLENPLAMQADQPLSDSTGAVLDPIMSLRKRVKVQPGHSIRVSYILAKAESRQAALSLADKYRDARVIDRAFELAWNRSRIENGYLDIKAEESETYLKLAASLFFPGPLRRKHGELIAKNKKGQPGLWPFGISGDLPLVLVHVNDEEQVDIVQRLLKAHEFWRTKGLSVDLVFLAEDEKGYVQPLQDMIREAIFVSHARDLVNHKGGAFLLNANQMEAEERILIYSVARLVFKGDAGTLEEQIGGPEHEVAVPELIPSIKDSTKVLAADSRIGSFDPTKLSFYNGFGGFSPDGMEYVIQLKAGQHTPAPWINVIANSNFGFNISEVGSGYTWAENSRENKITPWYNDPVTDPLSEAFYLRDEERGNYWSITPMPIRGQEDYIVRHGKGYTSFEHSSHGLQQKLTEFVALEDPVKLALVELKNQTEIDRQLSITYYMRPVLGVNAKVSSPYITTETGDKGTLLISNRFNSDFPGRRVFIDTSEVERSLTGDNYEFLGQGGSLEEPAALRREKLSGRVGAGLTPCGAMQIKLALKPNEVKTVVFLLGQGKDSVEALALARKYSKVELASEELSTVKAFWREKLGAIQVKTPDKAMDLLLNGWLKYQVIACRLWSRAAYYQSGGAYGFRDQLQDVMSVAYTWPELTRKQILLHAAHQFLEGDVQHWWHPGADKGIRTRYSDDLLWLPYVTSDYVEATNDWSVLDEVVGFLEDEPLPHDEDERYSIPRVSEQKASVYLHCVKAIEQALKFGKHGIPLMGSGDWNDGMNKVGNLGKGESVWLGWFLYTVLQKFIPLCKALDDIERAEKYSQMAKDISEAIEKHAWDGSWYKRAYFDDGKALGSAANTECKIDAIAQSWSVISGVGRPQRAEEAMRAVDNYLVDREAGIIKLLTPPFGDGDLEPGYIKGYVPGVRENGGQYTHAAVWTVLAFAKLGEGDKVGELFSLINPINHARTMMETMRYKVEPYVVAADVYAVSPNTGRGGWSWYTGAAGWMYRVGLEHILGIKKIGDKLYLDPCVPKDWQSFQIEYRLLKTLYKIQVTNPQAVNKGIKQVLLDQRELAEGFITLLDDGLEHSVEVVMG